MFEKIIQRFNARKNSYIGPSILSGIFVFWAAAIYAEDPLLAFGVLALPAIFIVLVVLELLGVELP